ncbi:MAG: UDP-N-acetylglucosamine pyrophosphorylase [Clostridia bacterium]|nr:UDP-N-acetylglucosamine pyrophosphorylase [Clostridia bacterium]
MDNYIDLSPKTLFPSGASIAYESILPFPHPWGAIPFIREIIKSLIVELDPAEYIITERGSMISREASVQDSAYIGEGCIVMSGAEIRHSAYLRSDALIGRCCVVGNSTEIKNSILFDGAKAPHFNYVGDSILGEGAHLGAGVIISNLKSDKTPVRVNTGADFIDTGLKKFGAIIGDGAEIGCGSVLNPGTVIGRGASIYPLSSVRGYVPENHIYKSRDNITKRL